MTVKPERAGIANARLHKAGSAERSGYPLSMEVPDTPSHRETRNIIGRFLAFARAPTSSEPPERRWRDASAGVGFTDLETQQPLCSPLHEAMMRKMVSGLNSMLSGEGC